MALKKGLPSKASPFGSSESSEGDEEEAPASSDAEGSDYKAIAKDAAKNGDWDACIDALCSYIDKK